MAVITGIDARLIKGLDLIGFSEGTSTESISKNDGYDVIVTGIDGPSTFDDYTAHPFVNKPAVKVSEGNDVTKPLYSTASGRYQFRLSIWKYYQNLLHLPDFSPLSQDKAALEVIKERQGDVALLSNDVATFITRCANIWASFPGNDYGQGGKSLEALLNKYATLA